MWANLLFGLLQMAELGEVVYGHAGFAAQKSSTPQNFSFEVCTAIASESHNMASKRKTYHIASLSSH
jgi:hypothetical protein